MNDSRPLRAVLAVLVLPHELGHALPAAVAGIPFTVTLLPDWDGTATPLGQFDAAIEGTTPTAVIRAVALAPLPIYVGLAAVLGQVLSLSFPLAVGAIVLCSWWGTLSGGDLAVAASPAAAKRAGRFVVRTEGWERTASDVLTVATTAVVAVLLLS